MRLRRPRNPVSERWRDPVIAAVWLVALEVENLAVNHGHRSVLAYGLVVAVMGVAAVWRRRAPLAFALVALTGASVLVAAWSNTNLTVAPVYVQAFVPYTIAKECPGARALFGLVAVLVWGTVIDVATGSNTAGSIAGLVITGASWGAGRWLRARRLLDAELVRNAEQIEAERASRVRLAVADERTRIARELHTLIAANVSAMVLQAEAAEIVAGRRFAGRRRGDGGDRADRPRRARRHEADARRARDTPSRHRRSRHSPASARSTHWSRRPAAAGAPSSSASMGIPGRCRRASTSGSTGCLRRCWPPRA